MAGGPGDITTPVAVESEEEPFDWVAFLREGDSDVHFYSSDTDTDDDWNLSEAEVQEKVSLSGSETEAQKALLPIAGTSGEPSARGDPAEYPSALVGREAASKSNLIKQCLLSKEWLANNVQDNWWLSSSLGEPGSSYTRINAAHLWNMFISQDGSNITGAEEVNTLTEYKVVREVLFMLQEPVDMRVFVHINDKFCVRSDVTIPSLTQRAFSKFLQEMCEYFDMLKELLDFGASLQADPDTNESMMPPLTYKAFYSLAVDEHLRKLRRAVVSLEAEVRKQEKPHTLISVKKNLQPFFDDLKTMYMLYKRATVFHWKNYPNWLCATCMLSVVYAAMEAAVDNHVASIVLAVFMKTFSPYLRIANKWLAGGQLEDVLQEFIITKTDCSVGVTYLDEYYSLRPFEDYLIEKGVKPAPILQSFGQLVLQAGKTIGFLHRMNRVAEIRRQPEQCGELFVKLSGDSSMLSVTLTDKIVTTVAKTLPDNSAAEDDADSNDDLKSVVKPKFNNTFLEFPKHLEQLADPYLLASFGYSSQTDSQSEPLFQDYKMEDSAETKVFKRLDGLAVCAVLPLQHMLQSQLDQLIGECHRAACWVVRQILLAELVLPTHFSLVRSILLNEAGDIMHTFATSIFAQVEQGILDVFSLSDNLVNCVDERFPEYSFRFAVVDCADEDIIAELRSSVSEVEVSHLQHVLSRAVSSMVLINKVQILYEVDWPISLFLNEANMKCYNKVFKFLLEVRWALHLLNHLKFTDLCSSTACTRRLQLLRFWHTHTLSSVHTYLMEQVLQLESFQLQHTLDEALDLDSFMEAHDNYVKTIYRKCFRPIKLDFIVHGVHQLVAQAYVLKVNWGSTVSEIVVDSLEAMYNHTHCMMVAVLRLHVEEDFDSEFEGLYSALDDTIPFPEIHL